MSMVTYKSCNIFVNIAKIAEAKYRVKVIIIYIISCTGLELKTDLFITCRILVCFLTSIQLLWPYFIFCKGSS